MNYFDTKTCFLFLKYLPFDGELVLYVIKSSCRPSVQTILGGEGLLSININFFFIELKPTYLVYKFRLSPCSLDHVILLTEKYL